MKKLVAGLGLVLVVGCGKNGLNSQEGQRSDAAPELRGAWSSLCEGSSIVSLSFDEKKLTVTQDHYKDLECKDLERTVVNAGEYNLASNFKEGINNSVVYVQDPTFQIAYHYDADITDYNNKIINNQADNEKPMDTTKNKDDQRLQTRKNSKIRETKLMGFFKRGVPNPMNRLQTEFLAPGDKPLIDFGTRSAFRYEVDNGFLQLAGPSVIGSRVYSKQ